ncbi:MAG: RNA polymerase sigma factor [Bacteroidota bacterium]
MRKGERLNATYTHIHADLVEACKTGDRNAQFRLYQLYAKAMFNICVRILGDRAAAEDALQEAFVSVFSKLHTFEGRASLGAWMKKIVINKCLSLLNKRRLFFEPLDENVQENVSADTPQGISEHDLNPGIIHDAIKELPEGCRVIFTLYQLEGYDHQEISDILNVSVSTSKSQFHRAKKLLQKKLKHKLPER